MYVATRQIIFTIRLCINVTLIKEILLISLIRYVMYVDELIITAEISKVGRVLSDNDDDKQIIE